MLRKRQQLGFTLLELLVVISIIGVLASIVLVSFPGAQRGGDGYRFGISGGRVAFLVGDASGHTETSCGSKTVNDNQWHHIVGVFSRVAPTTFRCYIDGKLIATVALPSAYPNMQTSTPAFGKPICCTAFSGVLDDIQIYSAALPQTYIQQLYVEGLSKHNLALNQK